MAKNKPIKIDIEKLEVREIFPRTQLINNVPGLLPSDKTKAIYGIQLNQLFNIESDAIKIELTVTIDLEIDNHRHKKVGEFAYDFIYFYQNLTDLTDDDGELTPEIFLTCSNISYSTLRGIIYAKSSNSCLDSALLPIVTGSELMKGLISEKN